MTDLRNVRGVIFDLDGTLLDSMEMWKEIDREYLARFGLAAPEDLQRRIEGMSVPDLALWFKQSFSIPDSPDKIIADWNAMAREEYLHRLPLKEGAAALVKALADAGIALGIATTNYRDLTEGCLERHGLLPYFSAVVTSREINRGKPDPEIYLKAAACMGTAPASCLVFEDIPAGILAGKRAGMQVVAVGDAASADAEEEKRQMADEFVLTPGDWLRLHAADISRLKEE